VTAHIEEASSANTQNSTFNKNDYQLITPMTLENNRHRNLQRTEVILTLVSEVAELAKVANSLKARKHAEVFLSSC
jgi:hypothetical protein